MKTTSQENHFKGFHDQIRLVILMVIIGILGFLTQEWFDNLEFGTKLFIQMELILVWTIIGHSAMNELPDWKVL